MTGLRSREWSLLSTLLAACMLVASVPAFALVPEVQNVASTSHPSDSTWYSDDSPEFSWDAASDLPKLLGTYDPYGVVANVAVAGDVAYLAVETGDFLMVDISEPGTMTLLGHRDRPSGWGTDVAIAGDVAYVAEGSNGLYMQDIAVPSGPTPPLGYYDTPGNAMGVALAGDVAYVADLDGGLQAIDISEPGTPTVLGTYATAGNALDVAVEGDVAYVCVNLTAYEDALEAIDISEPGTMTRLGIQETAETTWRVAVSGDVAYVGTSQGLQTVDVSDPTTMSMLGVCDTPVSARDVTIDGDIAYVADHLGLGVIDISDPSTPMLLGYRETPNDAWGVAVAGGIAYVADRHAGLHAFQVADFHTPTPIEAYDTPDYANTIAISGDVAYVADQVSGFQTLDISEPGTVTPLGAYDTPGIAYGVAVSGDMAYVADDAYGLHVLDVSEPGTPTLLGSCDTPGSAYAVEVAGDIAYVADKDFGLELIDVSDPLHPTLLGNYNTPGYAWDVAISGDVAYVGDYGGSSGLRIIDISDPAAPTLLGNYDTFGNAWDVAILGDVAYVANGTAGLCMIDISNPAVPTLLGTYNTPDVASGIAVSGDVAYVPDRNSGLHTIDVSNPAVPTLLGTFDTPDNARDVEIAGDVIFLADKSDGVLVFDVGDTPIAYSYDIDQSAATTPDRMPDTTATSASLGSLADGTWWFHVRGVGLRGEGGETSHRSVMIDATEPTGPSISALSHTPGTWSSDTTVGIEFSGATDGAGSGVDGFSVSWDTSSSATPDATKDYEESQTSLESASLSDGSWYVHVRTCDNAGNWTSTAHEGPFNIDTTNPSIASISSSTHPVESSWYADDSPGVTWAADADLSGVTGYSYTLDQTTDTTPDTTSDGSDASADYPGKADGVWYFHIRARDAAGNWGDADHRTIRIDITLPTTISNAHDSYVGSANITLTPSDGTGSGVANTYYRIDGGTWKAGTTVAVARPGSHTVDFKSIDNAGNEESFKTETFSIISDDTTYHALEGDDRFATSVEISQESYPSGADTVIIATARNWPDALGGAALAGAVDGPILLVDTDSIPDAVKGEIARLGATRAIILGGIGAVKPAVATKLASIGDITKVTRLGGANRYATAGLVADAAIDALGAGFDGTALVATGRNFPDALAGSPLSAANGWPIYLADPGAAPSELATQMKADGVTDAILLGGTAVVSNSYQSKLSSTLSGSAIRLAGNNRYATGVAIAIYGVDSAGLAWDGLALATGENFPDALAGGVLCARRGSVMLLTDGASLSSPVDAVLEDNRDMIGDVYYLGGNGAISQAVRSTVASMLH